MKGQALITFVSGVALGAVVALLMAPDKGSETRKKMKRVLKKGKSTITDFIDEIQEDFHQKSKGIKHGFGHPAAPDSEIK